MMRRVVQGVRGKAQRALQCGCFGRLQPISIAGRTEIERALQGVCPWQLDLPVDGRSPAILAALFDGTCNDRTHVPDGSRATVIADMARLLDNGGKLARPTRYYAGPGTQHNRPFALWDAAFGATTASRAEHACRDVVSDIADVRRVSPDADIRIVVAGFSRGAAAARHFMNLLDERFGGSAPRIHFYAVLFDTVATGQSRRLQLSLPPLADQVLHFVSLGERRIFFKPAIDEAGQIVEVGPMRRIATIPLPGAHSDVGVGYSDGVGLRYVPLVLSVLRQMGLIPQSAASVKDDYAIQGGRDSRWPFERVLGIARGGTIRGRARGCYALRPARMSDDRIAEWRRRQAVMVATFGGFQIDSTSHLMPRFDVHSTKAGLQLACVPDAFGRTCFLNPTLIRTGRTANVQYRVIHGKLQTVGVPRRVLTRLMKQKTAVLELGVVARARTQSGKRSDDSLLCLWWIIDDVVIARTGTATLSD